MFNQRLDQTGGSPIRIDPTLAGALERASRAIARLDQALDRHPLLPAFLYRIRLEAVRRQTAVDGQLIDPWHLAAVLEGLRLRMDHAMRIIDRGVIFDAARHALALHQWLTVPDFDQEGEVKQAEAVLETSRGRFGPLLSAALRMGVWLDRDGTRPPIRAALVRYWKRHHLLSAPVPLTGATALRAETPWAVAAWIPIFLNASPTRPTMDDNCSSTWNASGSARAAPWRGGAAIHAPPSRSTCWPQRHLSRRRHSRPALGWQ
jgi:hypothetical protein